MFSKKKTECRVCGYRFTPERENIYTAVVRVFSDEKEVAHDEQGASIL